MNNRLNPRSWRRPSLFAALVVFAAAAALPTFSAAAHGAGNDTVHEMDFGCELGSSVDYTKSCVFDLNSDGLYDWWVTDTDGDSVFDTSSYDTDFDGRAETFYTMRDRLYGDVVVRYDHDGDGLYDDEEAGLYYTDPYFWDTDGDSFNDNVEIAEGSDPLNLFCTPYGCG